MSLVVVPCGDQAVLETVARVKTTKKNETKEEKYINSILVIVLCLELPYMTFFNVLELIKCYLISL